MSDPSNGYEAIARKFIAGRGTGTGFSPGASNVRQWATGLRTGGHVLDIGCGSGVPISQTLIDGGFAVHGIDASPSMIAAFRARFPDVPAECNRVEASHFFDRRFDGVVAWGLIFLLDAEAQALLISKVAKVLLPGGQFLFTAPRQACDWPDNQTGQTSRSLGDDMYRRLVEAEGLAVVGEQEDEGGNHYYFARKSL